MPGPKSFESCGMDLRHHFLEWSITAPEKRLPKYPLLNSGKSPVFVCDGKAIKRTHLASALLDHIPQLTGWHFCRHTYMWLSYGPTPVVHCWNCSPQDSRCHRPNSPERTCGTADHFCRVPHVRKCDIRARYGRVEFGLKWGAFCSR